MPEIVVRPRKAGKTMVAIEWLLVDPEHRMILVPTEEIAKWTRRSCQRVLQERSVRAGYDLSASLDLKDKIRTSDPERLRGVDAEIYVDNADLVLAGFLGRSFSGATWNEDRNEDRR